MLIITEGGTNLVFGAPVFEEIDLKNYTLNLINPVIINDYSMGSNTPFVAKTFISLFFPYYIQGFGTVVRWSKNYYHIKNKFRELNESSKKTHSN